MDSRVLAVALAVTLTGTGAATAKAQGGGMPQGPGAVDPGSAEAVQSPEQVEEPGRTSGRSQTGEAFTLEGEVSDDELQRYVQALREIGREHPEVAEALSRGEAVDPTAIAQVTKEGYPRAGLKPGEIRGMAERIREDASVRARYERIARAGADTGQSGASGAAPAR